MNSLQCPSAASRTKEGLPPRMSQNLLELLDIPREETHKSQVAQTEKPGKAAEVLLATTSSAAE